VAYIDTTLNHGKFVINEKKIVSFPLTGVPPFYLKLVFPASSSMIKVTYNDISTNDIIPADFNYDDIIIITPPMEEEVWENQTVKIVNPFIDAMLSGAGTYVIPVITNTGSYDPSITHPYLYPDTANHWALKTIMTGLYAWTYGTGPL
jgi:hypothetical protein